MKIIFITREGYNLSGARVRCYNFARALKNYGINAEVFSFADNLGAKYGEEETEMGLSQKLKYNFQAYRILKELDKDSLIVMQRLNYHTLAPFLISILKRHKFIFDCDDWNIREKPRYILGVYPTSKAEFLTRKFAKRSYFCLAASKFLENYLSQFNGKVYYLPTGVDTSLFDPIFYDDTKINSKIVFSWIGSVYTEEMQENLKFIIDCFLSLAPKYSQVYLELRAEGKYLENLKKETNVLDGKISIKKWLHPDKIPQYLSGIEIGLLPLIQNTKFNRAKSPTKLFEYMAMGKPVVASFLGEAKEIIQDGRTGFLVRNKEEFIRKMESLIINQELRKRVGFEARKEVLRSYSLNVLGKRLYKILNGNIDYEN